MKKYPKYKGATDKEITVQLPKKDGTLPDLFKSKLPKDENEFLETLE